MKLISRLHVMICPSWTQTLTSPVDLRAVVVALVAAAKSEQHLGRTYDLAGCRPLTYLDMMRLTAQLLDLNYIQTPLRTLLSNNLAVVEEKPRFFSKSLLARKT
ncbi:MAG: hypothetical protein IPJ71_12690 [Bdellovibrionales bacterium]|nr:hypothetical protein [Bdellovibrionales bacterium]